MRQRWEPEELVEFWTLEADELALVANKSGTTRLGFAVLIKSFGYEARFPRHGEVPVEVVDFVARQVRPVRIPPTERTVGDRSTSSPSVGSRVVASPSSSGDRRDR